MDEFKINNRRIHIDKITDRQERIKWWRQDVIRNAKVLVVGAGAIGNEVIKNLALLGFGYIFVADYDKIEVSNLSRTVLFDLDALGKRKSLIAANKAKTMNVEASAQVDAFDGNIVWELGLGVFRRVNLVLGCLDNIEARLAINRACLLTQTPYIDSGILELAGSVYVFYPPFTSCLSCTTTKRERELHQTLYSCFGTKLKNYSQGRMATVQTTSAIIAGIQVEQAVKWLHKKTTNQGIRIQYDGGGDKLYFDVTHISQRDYCDCTKVVPLSNIVSIPKKSEQITLTDFINYLVVSFQLENPDVSFKSSFVIGVDCNKCNSLSLIMKPLYKVYNEDVHCQKCGIIGDRNILELNSISKSSDLDMLSPSIGSKVKNLTMSELGFPQLHIYEVYSNQNTQYFEMSGDENSIMPSLNGRKQKGENE